MAGLVLWLLVEAQAEERFRVATYNLENYLLRSVGDRPAKSPTARAKIRESIHQVQPDVLALQELGSPASLDELREALRAEGLDFPHGEFVRGYDTNVHIGLLSRFPVVRRVHHTNDTFLLRGRRLRVTRGFVEVDLEINRSYRLTLLVAHLKSKRTSNEFDETEVREQEAALLREKIEVRLLKDPAANLLVAGDLNDHRSSRALRRLLGPHGPLALIDARPGERHGYSAAAWPQAGVRAVTWTHHYVKEDVYSRFDYLLMSPGLAREWQRDGSFVLALPDWGVGSDHRPVVAEFVARDR